MEYIGSHEYTFRRLECVKAESYRESRRKHTEAESLVSPARHQEGMKGESLGTLTEGLEDCRYELVSRN